MSQALNRCALGICIVNLLAVVPSPRAFAQLTPGLKLCSLTDSVQTITSEKIELHHRLLPGYHSFEIVSQHNNELKVVVQFETAAMAEKHVAIDKIRDIWESVLQTHHRDCGYSTLSVEFVTSSGKELLTAGTEY